MEAASELIARVETEFENVQLGFGVSNREAVNLEHLVAKRS